MAKYTNSVYKSKLDYNKKKSKEEMKKQLISFALMILFTIVAFGMVLAGISEYFVIPILLVLAAVQVGFQLYYFMHMSDKGHTMPALMFYCGAFIAFITILTFTVLIWW